MEALRAPSFSSFHFAPAFKTFPRTHIKQRPIINLPSIYIPNASFFLSRTNNNAKFRMQTAIHPIFSTDTTDPPEQDIEIVGKDEKFDWFSQWYPVMPVCDLDKSAPHGKKVVGLDIVVWWDKNESAWKVFDDSCPHRLAPLSEGRIDQWGRLQCVYHGWCFSGAGDCKFIPQAPRDGPPSHTSKKACVAVYPSTVQNDIVWFWPNTDPKYEDILSRKMPPYIPEIGDPSYTSLMGNREIKYGYEVLVENLLDPAHVPYAHYGLNEAHKNSKKVDREGGRPLKISIKKQDLNGFTSEVDGFPSELDIGGFDFVAPCIVKNYATVGGNKGKGSEMSAENTEKPAVTQKRVMLIFICVPVSPGNSRLIWCFTRNFAVWIDKIVPRWMFHVGQNLGLDSDLYLLHVEERKILDIGLSNWRKACYVPTKSDTIVVTYRRWSNKYAGGQFDWGTKFSGSLSSSPSREQIFDRYRSHVVNCRSCSSAHKGLKALEVALQIIAIASIGAVAATKENMISAVMKNTLVAMAVLCFAASKLLSHFIYKNFHFHDYNHALR